MPHFIPASLLSLNEALGFKSLNSILREGGQVESDSYSQALVLCWLTLSPFLDNGVVSLCTQCN